ncbi:AAA family ATPase [Allorhizobium sonneratiae]|uniref:AAA family ATPase n=1 Tax=Allorhizobium sonneratiae TaxID=2934936 RepID=UPI0020331F47|nr:AAA family ATPase [Allorhizobium sonneratiae]
MVVNQDMFFSVIQNWNEVPPDAKNQAFLVVDRWDDWFKYQTMFTLWVFDENAEQHHLGSVKIGQIGLKPSGAGVELGPGVRSPDLEKKFDALDDRFFSLGQEEDYYETLSGLSATMRQRILIGLRDCAYDLNIFESVRDEPVMTTSVLRSTSVSSVRGRLHRLANGDATLTEFKFNYIFPSQSEEVEPPKIRFEVVPESRPPTNVHVLIGRNGVGKTRCMRGISLALLKREPENDDDAIGRIVEDANEGEEWSFTGLVIVSFSAFDDVQLRPLPSDPIRSAQVGLLQWKTDEDGEEYLTRKTPNDLANDFKSSFSICRRGLRSDRWAAAVKTLEGDDLFAEANVSSLLELGDDVWQEEAFRLFRRLSSGHAIVLLTVTKLVELVDERTLVLLDEPEGHLHPPLLSAFIRALSDLLVKRNGVAIVATHSPVVLQEVPRSCAWKLRRSGAVSIAERPVVETFGENVGVLTREVFGFEITKSGFHRMLDEAVNFRGLDYDAAIDFFAGQVGAEARGVIRALVAERDAEA